MEQKHLTKKAKSMTDAAMTPPGYEAAEWADKLIKKAHRGPGDTVDAAMHRVSTKHRIDHGTLWRLRYRKPEDVMASVWKQLKAAYEAEIGRQEAKLAHELEITKTLRGTHASPSPAEVEAEAVLRARRTAQEEA